MSHSAPNRDLSEEQQSSLEMHMQELETWVKRLEIAPKYIDEDAAVEFLKVHPLQICSLLDESTTPSYSSAVGLSSQLVPAFINGVDMYYTFGKSWDMKPDDTFPFLYVFFNCLHCGDSESEGNGCEVCENGEIMYELMWDESGFVTAHKTT